jgi:tetratricopeptide (TPR) repeat protein
MRSVTLAVALLVALPAAAQPAAKKEEAQRLFREGSSAYNLGKYDEAAALFERTYRLMRHPAFVYNMAQAYRKLWEANKKPEFLRRAISAYQATIREDREGKFAPLAEKFIPELNKALAAVERRERDALLESGAAGEGLRAARKLLDEGQREEARKLLERLGRQAGVAREVLAQSYLLRATIAALANDRAQAVDLFKRALLLQPVLEPAEAGGPVREAFVAAREALGGARLTVAAWPPGQVRRGEPVTVPVVIENDPLGMVDAGELHYRVAGSGAFSTSRGKRGAALPLPPSFLGGLLPGTKVEFYVRILDANGAVLANLGTPQVPYVFTVRSKLGAAPVTHWYGKWWVWTIVGAVAISASTTAAILATRGGGADVVRFPAAVR